jgi:hypothetical protein
VRAQRPQIFTHSLPVTTHLFFAHYMAFRFREDSKKEFEGLGYLDLRWDEEFLQPEEGFPPIKTKEYPESVWDEAMWPLSPSKNRPRVRFFAFLIHAMCT